MKTTKFVTKTLLTVLSAALLFNTPAAGETYYVAPENNNPGPHDFKSPESAATNIMDVVNLAANGDIIHLADGTYLASAGDEEIISINNLSLNFVGNTNDPSVVTLDGGGAKRAINAEFTVPEFSFSMAGITVSNCFTDASEGGGGVYINYNNKQVLSGNVTIDKCRFIDNSVPHGIDGVKISGGALRLSGHSSNPDAVTAFLRDCYFAENRGSSGGAFYPYNTRAILEDCIAENNVADSYSGGGFAYTYFSDVEYINCTFTSNKCVNVSSGGGLALVYGGVAILNGCMIAGNTTDSGNGSVIYTRGSIFATNSIFKSNKTLRSGTIFARQEAPAVHLYNCLMTDNESSGYAVAGGNNCTGEYVIANSTIAYNPVSGGVTASDKQDCIVRIKNSIIHNNIYSSGKVVNYGGLGGPGDRSISFSLTTPLPAPGSPQDGGGNIDAAELDPLFTAPEEGDFRLGPGSPCINTGSNEAWMASATDLDNGSRLDRLSGIVDMGCYEFVATGSVFIIR